MGLVEILQSKKGKKFMGYLYGWGASIVIVGAMFKIQHWPFAGPMLVVGLSVEAVIFFFSAFEPIHEEIDWSLVYPELAHVEDGEEHALEMHDDGADHAKAELDDQGTITEQLDNMLEEAKIGPDLIESLGEGLRGLTDTAHKLSDISDASVATQAYVSSVKDASRNVGELSESYAKASQSLSALNISPEDGAAYSEQLQKVSTNLAALNNVYELQLDGASKQAQYTTQMYEGIGKLVDNLNDSISDTQAYKENIGELAKNLGQLNRVYGNMLNAMQMGNGNQG